MKKLLLIVSSFVLGIGLIAQTTIYENNFNSGSAVGWALNTSGSGENQWIVNAAYTGFAPFIPNTPSQPLAITAGPNSSYLHIYNVSTCSALGVCNAVFDTGSASNRSAESPVINTAGYSSVTASFYYLCAGQAGTSYGVVEYSTNGGTSWTQSGGQLSGVATWTLLTISDAALSNAANLKIRFRWQNGGAGLDPAFAVDDFRVAGTAGGNSITTTGGILPNNWCQGVNHNLNVAFVSSGTFNTGNVYTAQISDASGSFALPTSIGTLSSTASGSLAIAGVAPGSLGAGTGYRVRVVASNPATTGIDNGANLTINALPSVSLQPFAGACINGQSIVLSGGSPSGGSFSGPGVSGGSFNPVSAGLGSHPIIYTFTNGNGCQSSASQTITVNSLPTVIFTPIRTVCVNAANINLSSGSPMGGSYSGLGVANGVFNPATAGIGTHQVVYSFSDINGCQGSATQSITVNSMPTVVFSPLNNVCANGASISLSGGTPAGGTYSGSGVSVGVFNPATAGAGSHPIVYSYVDANGCQGSASQSIVVNNVPTVSFMPLNNVCSNGPSLTLFGGTPSGGTYSGTGVSAGVFSPATAGIGSHPILYSYTDINGCTGSASQSIQVDGCSGIGELNLINVVVYPNPTNTSFSVLGLDNIESLELLDLTGKVVQRYTQIQEKFFIEELPAGLYIVSVYTSNGSYQTKLQTN